MADIITRGHRLRRLLIVLAGGMLVLLLAAFLLVRWAIDPATLKPLAEARISAALGQPVTIGTLRLSLVPVLAVEGAAIAVGRVDTVRKASLSIRAVRIVPRFWSIFRKPIVVDRVEIDGLSLVCSRDASGRWGVPVPSGSLAAAGAEAGNGQASFDVAEISLTNGRLTVLDTPPRAAAAATSIENIAAKVHRVTGETRLDDLSATIGTSRVGGGGVINSDGLRLHLAWTDLAPGDLPVVFALLGAQAPAGLLVAGRSPLTLELAVAGTGDVSASGRGAADKAALGTLTLTALQSPVRLAANHLSLDPMTFRSYEGTGRAHVGVNLSANPATWSIDGELDGIDIDRFLSDNTSAKGRVSGTAALDARLRGATTTPVARSVSGTVRADVSDGVVRNFGLVAALYEALRLGGQGERDFRFQQLAATFAVAGEQASTQDLVARTGELTFLARGTIGFDQQLALDGTALFSPAKSAQMIRSVHELSALTNAEGQVEVPVKVSGTLGSAQFSIDVWSMARRGVANELKRRLGDKLKDIFKKR